MHRTMPTPSPLRSALHLIAMLCLFCVSARAGDNDAVHHEPTVAPAPDLRRGGSLVVSDPPRAPSRPDFVPRMRTHVDGALSAGNERVWVGPPVPRAVELEVGGRELFLLDPVEGGHLAFYREPYGGKSCTLQTRANCGYLARFYGDDGDGPRWSLDLGTVMSRPSDLEVQDLRYADGVLYFNEACASYSRQAKGRCASLIAWDPATQQVLWRTKPLTSNGRFLVHGELLISGYGFTGEPDAVFLVSRATGRVLSKQRLRTAHETLAVDGDVLSVVEYSGKTRRFRLVGLGTKRPRMQPIP